MTRLKSLLGAIVIVAPLAALVGSLQAQEPPPVGARVRVSFYERQPQFQSPFSRQQVIRGEATQFRDDTLFIRPAPATGELAVPLARVRTLDRSRGVPSRLRSAVINGLAGAAGGALFLSSTYGGRYEYGVTNRGEAAALGAGIGFVSGAVLGAVFPVERWRRVHLSR